jgi:hypothetical protein
MVKFRFENLEIWQRSVDIAGKLDDNSFFQNSSLLALSSMLFRNQINLSRLSCSESVRGEMPPALWSVKTTVVYQ